MGNPRIFPGYRGYADIDTIGQIRFGDANISAKQVINAPDMIMGDWDRDAYNFGPIEVTGAVSGPVTETFADPTNGVFLWGCKREGWCGTLADHNLTLYYYCGTADGGNTYRARTFSSMRINSLGFSCAAGDVSQFNIDLIGTSAGGWQQVDPPLNLGVSGTNPSEKLITWDKVSVSIAPGADESVTDVDFTTVYYSNFDFNIANNIETKYSLGQPNLFPFELVPGLRTITGTLQVYNTPLFDGRDRWDDYLAANISTISFNIGSLPISMYVRFHRVEPASSVGAIVSSVGFSGVTHQVGTPWE
jgi:hypothetical protein